MTFQRKIKKAISGNRSALYELIDEQRDKLYRIAYLYVKNENDAIDIFQETTYKAFKSIHNLKEPDFFHTWLTKILINTSLDFIKRNQKVIPFENVEDYAKTEGTPLEARMDLMAAIDKLSATYKTVIILRFYKDFTVKQIAEILDCPEGTVKTYLHRATNQLKKELKEEDWMNG